MNVAVEFFFTKQCFCLSSLEVSEVHSHISSCFQGNCLAGVQRPFIKYFLGMQKMPRTTKNLISYAHLLFATNIGHDINFCFAAFLQQLNQKLWLIRQNLNIKGARWLTVPKDVFFWLTEFLFRIQNHCPNMQKPLHNHFPVMRFGVWWRWVTEVWSRITLHSGLLQSSALS